LLPRLSRCYPRFVALKGSLSYEQEVIVSQLKSCWLPDALTSFFLESSVLLLLLFFELLFLLPPLIVRMVCLLQVFRLKILFEFFSLPLCVKDPCLFPLIFHDVITQTNFRRKLRNVKFVRHLPTPSLLSPFHISGYRLEQWPVRPTKFLLKQSTMTSHC
jgi:hypothetical protein